MVSFLLGLIQGLILPALYYFTKKLLSSQNISGSVPVPNFVLGCIAVAGFLAEVQFGLFASVRNDVLGALAFIVALTLLMPRGQSSERRETRFETHRSALIIGSFILGCSTGMKPTNVVYVLGFAAAVLCIMPNWRDRFWAALLCGVFGWILGFSSVAKFWQSNFPYV